MSGKMRIWHWRSYQIIVGRRLDGELWYVDTSRHARFENANINELAEKSMWWEAR